MVKKRKRSSDVPAAGTVEKPDDSAPQQPECTLFVFKDQPDLAAEHVSKDVGPFFRNKQKVLITCSCRNIYRYRHLMQNVVTLLPHAKKDNKVESKESKGSALNELVELRSCSSFFFEQPHWKLSKEMITKIFATPKDHWKAKPACREISASPLMKCIAALRVFAYGVWLMLTTMCALKKIQSWKLFGGSPKH